MVHAGTRSRLCGGMVSASIALSSQVNGGCPAFGRPVGMCTVRALSGSPQCRCALKRSDDSRLCAGPMNVMGTPVFAVTGS
jgi:hypothetical protein